MGRPDRIRTQYSAHRMEDVKRLAAIPLVIHLAEGAAMVEHQRQREDHDQKQDGTEQHGAILSANAAARILAERAAFPMLQMPRLQGNPPMPAL